MIDILGIGVPRMDRWLLHRVCARIPRGRVVGVCSADRSERIALLDAISGQAIPEEGRLWVSGVPLVRGRESRVRELVAEVALSSPIAERRSALWNTLARRSGLGVLGRFLRYPRERERRGALRALARVGLERRSGEMAAGFGPLDRARLGVAGCLWRGPQLLVAPELDATLSEADTGEFLELLRGLSRIEGLSVIVSGGPTILGGVDRALELSEGLLTFDGAPADLLRRRETKSVAGGSDQDADTVSSARRLETGEGGHQLQSV
jgi:ABC-type phosphate/phosphonate transport system ATPase subunit